MNWKGRSVLVTGEPVLSDPTYVMFSQAWSRLRAVDALLSGSGANLSSLKGADVDLTQADLRNVDLRPLCEGSRSSSISPPDQPYGWPARPLTDIDINAVAQVRLIEAVRETAPSAIVVHASTRQFYGRVEHLP